MRGNSFANGNSMNNGASMTNGPGAQELAAGWGRTEATIWDHLEPPLPH